MAQQLHRIAGTPRASLLGDARETSGVTTALLLAYLERAGGHTAVAAVLDRCGLAACEAELREESGWVSWNTKVALFEAAAAVLDTPDFVESMASFALDAGVGAGVKIALRALGSPRLVYRSIVRANARFNRSHAIELVSLDRAQARLRFLDLTDARRFHPLDCRYSAEMLRVVPMLFGLPRAQLRHISCAGDGAELCEYELHWREQSSLGRRALGTAGLSLAALAGTLTLLPAAVPEVIGAATAASGLIAVAELRRQRRSAEALQREVDDHAALTERLFDGLHDLVSDLRLEEVIAKVTRHAQAAVGGREFALLVRDGERFAAQSSSGLPASTLQALEAWCAAEPRVAERGLVLEDLSTLPTLAELAHGPAPLRCLASAPLQFVGESLGALIALEGQARTFLPRDLEVLQSFATQVAIAVHNARRYHITKTQADIDALTGLLNHRSFHEALEAAIAVPGPGRGCLVLLDLDNFKQVNDEDGHGAGDAVLRSVAAALTAGCREDDLAFRVGGDEFALLLPGLEERAAVAVAARVCTAIAELDPRLGACAGVAELASGLEKGDVMRRADALLYRAKRERPEVGQRTAVSSGGAARVTVDVLTATLALHHAPTATHCDRVAELSERVAERLGAEPLECLLVHQAALLHDLGKLAVPAETLDRPGPLSPAEWTVMRRHPERAAELIVRVPGLAALAETVRTSHERLDGSGYPAGLRGAEISRPARVVAVCDAFCSMTEPRPYRRPRSQDATLRELSADGGRRFDATIVAALADELASRAPRAAA